MRVPFSPYSPRAFAGTVRRRFFPPPRRDDVLDDSISIGDSRPDFWLGFVGDLCPLWGRTPVIDDSIVQFFSGCDRLIGNLEGVFSDRSWRPLIMLHDEGLFHVLEAIAPLDHWLLSVANNHAADGGTESLVRTRERLAGCGIQTLGTTETPRLAITDDISLSAWTWWTNLPSHTLQMKDPGPGSDKLLSIAFPHWGYEGIRSPHASQHPPGGYALTVGHHSHLPQRLQALENDRFVAWSLGNFITGKRLRILKEGAVLKVGLAAQPGQPPRIVRLDLRETAISSPSPGMVSVRFRNLEKTV